MPQMLYGGKVVTRNTDQIAIDFRKIAALRATMRASKPGTERYEECRREIAKLMQRRSAQDWARDGKVDHAR